MASPVDTSVKHFLSTMANAPVLSGTAGSLIALLDALLVTGFDIKTLTSLTVAGGVATAAFTGVHSAIVDSVIQVAGVTGGPSGFAGHNGEQKVTADGPGAVKYSTTLPDGTYTGTITIKMAPLGWTKVYAGTNKAAYKSSDVAANGHFLRVDDSNAQFARVRGFEAMSDVDTGTGPFPTDAILSGGGYWPKSLNSNANAVVWSFVGDSRLFYFSPQPGSSGNSALTIGNARVFGDPVALRPSGDPFATVLNYASTPTTANMYDACLGNVFNTQPLVTPRAYPGLGSAVLQVPNFYGNSNSSVRSGVSGVHGAFPSQINGELLLIEYGVGISSTAVSASFRSKLPGLYFVPQSNVWDFFKDGNKAPGTGALAGRNLMAMVSSDGSSGLNTTASNTNSPIVFIDVTGPWPR